MRGLLVAVGAAAMVVGLVGCSSEAEPPAQSEETSAETTADETTAAEETPSESPSASGASVVIDGEDQNVDGTVTCITAGGNVNITIGEGLTGILASVSEGDSPTVSSVALGNVNGVALAVGMGAGNATAEKDGATYTITGEASGIDMANPLTPVTKPFEMVVTCP